MRVGIFIDLLKTSKSFYIGKQSPSFNTSRRPFTFDSKESVGGILTITLLFFGASLFCLFVENVLKA